MLEDLNDILNYLKIVRKQGYKSRTKLQLRLNVICRSSKVDAYISRLSRDGYIRVYMHPRIGLQDTQELEADLKVYYSISDSGRYFIKKGGYRVQSRSA